MILKCPICGEEYEIQSTGNLDDFKMNCQSCGALLAKRDEIKIEDAKSYNVTINPIRKEKSSNWKWVITILIILFAFMVISRPGKEKHEEKLKQVGMEVINDGVKDKNDFAKGIAFLLGPSFMDLLLAGGFQVDDYVIFNIGRIKYNDMEKPITIGAFNTVFLLVSSDQIIENARKAAEEPEGE